MNNAVLRLPPEIWRGIIDFLPGECCFALIEAHPTFQLLFAKRQLILSFELRTDEVLLPPNRYILPEIFFRHLSAICLHSRIHNLDNVVYWKVVGSLPKTLLRIDFDMPCAMEMWHDSQYPAPNALHLDALFPHLQYLRLRSTTWEYLMNDISPDWSWDRWTAEMRKEWWNHLPASLVSLDLKHWNDASPDMFERLVNLQELVDLDSRLPIEWLPRTLNSVTRSKASHRDVLPPQLTALHIINQNDDDDDYGFFNLMLSALPRTLKALSLQGYDCDPWNAAEDEEEVSFPPLLTSLSLLHVMDLPYSLIPALPRTLTSLEWSDWATIEPDMLDLLPPRLLTLKLPDVSLFDIKRLPRSITHLAATFADTPQTMAQTRCEDFPPKLTRLKVRYSISTGSQLFMLLPILPPNLSHLEISGADDFTNEQAALLPKHLLSLSVDHTKWDERVFDILPSTLRQLHIESMCICGACLTTQTLTEAGIREDFKAARRKRFGHLFPRPRIPVAACRISVIPAGTRSISLESHTVPVHAITQCESLESVKMRHLQEYNFETFSTPFPASLTELVLFADDLFNNSNISLLPITLKVFKSPSNTRLHHACPWPSSLEVLHIGSSWSLAPSDLNGSPSCLPHSLTDLTLKGLFLSGSGLLPPSLTSLSCYFSGPISAAFSALPPSLLHLSCFYTFMFSSEHMKCLPRGLTALSFANLPTLNSGCLRYLPPDLTALNCPTFNIIDLTDIKGMPTDPEFNAIQLPEAWIEYGLQRRLPHLIKIPLTFKCDFPIEELSSLPSNIASVQFTAPLSDTHADRKRAVLPANLQELDLSNAGLIHRSLLSALPSTVTSLFLRSSSKEREVHAELYQALPRNLKKLSIRQAPPLDEASILALPAGLLSLHLTDITWMDQNDISKLPRSLTELRLPDCEVPVKAIPHLPPNLRRLALSYECSKKVLETITEVQARGPLVKVGWIEEEVT